MKRIVSLGLLGGVLALVFRREGAGALVERLDAVAWLPLGLAVALAWLAVFASARRWQLLLRLEGVERSGRWVLGSFLRGRFVGAFTPSTVGLDLYRLVDLGAGHRAPGARALLVEKLYGLVALAMVSVALLPFGLQAMVGDAGVVLALGLGVVALVGVGFVERPAALAWLAPRLPGALGRFAERAASALRAGRPDPLSRLRILGLGLVTHLATATVFAATGAALWVEVGPMTLAIVGNAIVLTTLLPISVGGIGVREGTAVALLAAYGVGAADAALLAFLGYLCAQPPALLGGLWQVARGSSEPNGAPLPSMSPRMG